MKNNKLGVSAVIGVILMVAVTVAIAGVVYIYLTDIIENSIKPSISGTITKKEIRDIGLSVAYFFILDNTTDVKVTQNIYYKYNVGDYYESRY